MSIMGSSGEMKFGFIVHCRSMRELRLALARYRLAPHLSLLPQQRLTQYCLERGFIEDIFTFGEVVSDRQGTCQGKAYCLLLTPAQLLEHQARATELVIEACARARQWGARMIGLGAICAVIGARGVEVAAHCPAAVTTGNSLTAYAALVQYEKLLARLDVDPVSQKAVLIGFPGSIMLVLAKMLHARGVDVVLVSRRKTAFLRKFLDSLGPGAGSVELTQDIATALQLGKIVFSATSTGQIITQDMLQPGSIVFDIAQPKDVVYCRPLRPDVLIVDAGLISLPRATRRKYRYSGWLANDIPSCLGETITLTLEQRWENFSLGRELSIDKMMHIGELAEQHGFVFDNFRTFARPIPGHMFAATRNALLETGGAQTDFTRQKCDNAPAAPQRKGACQ